MDKSQQAYAQWYRECGGQPNELRVIWDAAWQASRKQAHHEVALYVEVTEPSPIPDMGARFDLAAAIRSLEGNAKETT